jgi:hypothetical protein
MNVIYSLQAVGAAALLVLFAMMPETVRAADPLEVGLAAADITPRLDSKQPIWLAGLENNRAATGVHDPLFARAVVLRSGQRKIALVSVDSIGLQYPSVLRVRGELKEFAYVLVASTHSHASPDVIGVWGPSPAVSGVVPDYVRLVETKIVDAVRQADAAVEPVRAEYATADDESLLSDYRLPEIYDSVLRVLRFVRLTDGKPHGLLVQWNSHGVEPRKNLLVSRDFMGVTVEILEKRHGCAVVYFQGAIGGLMGTPDKRFRDEKGELIRDGFTTMRLCGEAIADLADRALRRPQPISLTPLEVFARPIMVPLDNPRFRAARAAGVLTRPIFAWTGGRDRKGDEIAPGKTDGEQAMETEVAYLRLGELDVAAIPGELYPELVVGKFQEPADPAADFPHAPLEKPVLKILRSSKLLILGLANDEIGYIVPKRQWDVAPPFAYGRSSAQYGEGNSLGPETARMLTEALAERVAEASQQPIPAEAGFEKIFDGRSLDGWLGQDMSFWSIEDEAITGTISPAHAPTLNQYLVWQPELVDDFELKLDFRLTGSATPNTNGGFQFRSRRLPNGDVAGYQVDNNFAQPWKVRLYDEFGRHDLALEGERSRFDAEGRRHVEKLTLEAGASDFRLDQWHEYHLTAAGPHLTLKINDKLVAECSDNDREQYEPVGVLAMQLHTGPPMKAQFRSLRIKRLQNREPLSARQRLLATAALNWQLGERPASHQPPLNPVGKITAGLAAEGSAARAGAKIARLENGYFDAGAAWNTPARAITVYLRARVPDGDWKYALFAKRGGHDRVNFNLFSVDLSDTPGPDVGFEIRTDRGFFQASFPVANIDATAWHDLVGQYDGQSIRILCDGKVMAQHHAEGDLAQNSEPILIGAETDNGQVVRQMTGEIEEAALWTRSLADDELGVLVK